MRNAWSAPRQWPPRPWMGVNRTRIRPTPKAEIHTCWEAKPRTLLLANAHIEKAGAAIIPIVATTKVRIMLPVQAPPCARAPSGTSWIGPGMAR